MQREEAAKLIEGYNKVKKYNLFMLICIYFPNDAKTLQKNTDEELAFVFRSYLTCPMLIFVNPRIRANVSSQGLSFQDAKEKGFGKSQNPNKKKKPNPQAGGRGRGRGAMRGGFPPMRGMMMRGGGGGGRGGPMGFAAAM